MQALHKLDKNESIQKSVMQMALKGTWFNRLPANEQNALRSLENHPISEPLSEDQSRAFSAYTGGSFEYINNYLRTSYRGISVDTLPRYKGETGKLNRENDEKYINNMNEAFRHALPIPNQITVYRGCGNFLMGEGGNNLLLLHRNEIVGKKIIEPAFLSTSANRTHAEHFAKKVLLIITVPAEIPAFYVTKELEGRTISGKLRDEDEVIFAPGRKMRIDRAEKKGILILHVTMEKDSSNSNIRTNLLQNHRKIPKMTIPKLPYKRPIGVPKRLANRNKK